MAEGEDQCRNPRGDSTPAPQKGDQRHQQERADSCQQRREADRPWGREERGAELDTQCVQRMVVRQRKVSEDP
ncbi:MAG: hypothetical protein L6W00_22705 [Lentisphaeria bacterium]|nr:MAG: hypothetical protein L6W00_22705 [Lentisphaeria bacterium]